jgi:hypothetical protein
LYRGIRRGIIGIENCKIGERKKRRNVRGIEL